MNKIKTIKFTIESDLDLSPLLGKAIKGICSSFVENETDLYHIELCIVEAVNNIIVHAYENKEGEEINIHMHLAPDHLVVQAFDTGKKGNPLTGNLEKANSHMLTFNPEDLRTLPESGMGIFIIKSYMDEIRYEVQEGKNIITMRKNFPTHTP